MKSLAIIAILLIALFASALSFVFVYGLLWGVLWFVSSSFVDAPYSLYITASLSLLAFIFSTVAVIRKNSPTLHDLRWDSGTVEEAPSQISVPGEGGRLWNVNPLGANSISSVGQIFSAFLCMPAGIFITLLRCGINEARNEK